MIHQPLIEPVPGMWQVRLMADYPYPGGLVPSWFSFDGASVPPFGWQLTYTPFHPVVLGPACAHDWEYMVHRMTRAQADLMFLEMLLENGANPTKARMMYAAVQTAGRYYWTQNQSDIQRLRYMHGMCRGRAEYQAYGFPQEMAA